MQGTRHPSGVVLERATAVCLLSHICTISSLFRLISRLLAVSGPWSIISVLEMLAEFVERVGSLVCKMGYPCFYQPSIDLLPFPFSRAFLLCR